VFSDFSIESSIDFAHPARAKEFSNFESAPDHIAGSEHRFVFVNYGELLDDWGERVFAAGMLEQSAYFVDDLGFFGGNARHEQVAISARQADCLSENAFDPAPRADRHDGNAKVMSSYQIFVVHAHQRKSYAALQKQESTYQPAISPVCLTFQDVNSSGDIVGKYETGADTRLPISTRCIQER
jgi:hypothetical protein